MALLQDHDRSSGLLNQAKNIQLVTLTDLPEMDVWSLLSPGASSGRASIWPGLSRSLSIKAVLPSAVTHQARLGLVHFPDVMVCRLNDVVLRGADVIYQDETAAFVEGFHPRYAFDLFPSREAARAGHLTTTTVDLDAPAVCISHWTSGTYGHFLIEMLPKIITFQALKCLEPRIKLVVSSFCSSALMDIIRLFVAESDIIRYDYLLQSVRVKSLFLISNAIERGAIHPFVDGFLTAARSQAVMQGHLGRGRRLFLSKSRWRSAHPDYRQFDNEEEIENLVARCGFDVVHPEQMSWLEQVATFSAAEVIVGEYTSALHNAIFAPPGATVIGLNYVNEVQDCIAAFRGHQLGYVLPTDGQARRWQPDSPEVQSQNFAIDPNRVREILRLIGV